MIVAAKMMNCSHPFLLILPYWRQCVLLNDVDICTLLMAFTLISLLRISCGIPYICIHTDILLLEDLNLPTSNFAVHLPFSSFIGMHLFFCTLPEIRDANIEQ